MTEMYRSKNARRKQRRFTNSGSKHSKISKSNSINISSNSVRKISKARNQIDLFESNEQELLKQIKLKMIQEDLFDFSEMYKYKEKKRKILSHIEIRELD